MSYLLVLLASFICSLGHAEKVQPSPVIRKLAQDAGLSNPSVTGQRIRVDYPFATFTAEKCKFYWDVPKHTCKIPVRVPGDFKDPTIVDLKSQDWRGYYAQTQWLIQSTIAGAEQVGVEVTANIDSMEFNIDLGSNFQLPFEGAVEKVFQKSVPPFISRNSLALDVTVANK